MPGNVVELLDQRCAGGENALLDVYFPRAVANEVLPTVVWIHGGGFVVGDGSDVRGYLKILAGSSYVTTSVG